MLTLPGDEARKGHLVDLGVGRGESHIFLWGEEAPDGASR